MSKSFSQSTKIEKLFLAFPQFLSRQTKNSLFSSATLKTSHITPNLHIENQRKKEVTKTNNYTSKPNLNFNPSKNPSYKAQNSQKVTPKTQIKNTLHPKPHIFPLLLPHFPINQTRELKNYLEGRKDQNMSKTKQK